MLKDLRLDHWQKIARTLDFKAWRRPAGWGGGALLALIVVVYTTESETGTQRLRQIFSAAPEPTAAAAVAQIKSPDPALERLTQRLGQALKILNDDRAKLTARLASLEQNLDTITGSIKKSTAAAPVHVAAPAATATAAEPSPAVSKPVVSMPAAPSPPPAAAMPAAAMPPPMLVFAAAPFIPAGSPALWPANTVHQASAPATAVPIPPIRTPEQPSAKTVAPEASKDQDSIGRDNVTPSHATPSQVVGIDLGGARSIDALTIHWSSMKIKFGASLKNLLPVVAIRERKPGVPELRLIAGPLPDPDAATKICMTLVAARAPCRPATFYGQRLLLR